MTLDELPVLREKTERIAALLQKRLRRQLDTLQPLLAPARVFGRYVGGKDTAAGAEESWTRLQESYRGVCGKPFGLAPQLEVNALESLDARLEIWPWEYAHEVGAEKDRRTITVTAPLRWILGYRTASSPAQIRQSLRSPADKKPDAVRQFLVQALALGQVLDRNPGVAELLRDLRYTVARQPAPGLGELPLVTVEPGIQSSRPGDDIVLAATRLSGVPAFVELVDLASLEHVQDALIDEIRAAVA